MSLLRSRPLLLVASGATFLWFACCGAGNKFHNGSRQLYWRMPAQRQISKEQEEEEKIGWVGVFQEPGAVGRQLGRYIAHGIRRGTALHCARYAEWERERERGQCRRIAWVWICRGCLAYSGWLEPLVPGLCRSPCRWTCVAIACAAAAAWQHATHMCQLGKFCCVFTVSLGPR